MASTINDTLTIADDDQIRVWHRWGEQILYSRSTAQISMPDLVIVSLPKYHDLMNSHVSHSQPPTAQPDLSWGDVRHIIDLEHLEWVKSATGYSSNLEVAINPYVPAGEKMAAVTNSSALDQSAPPSGLAMSPALESGLAHTPPKVSNKRKLPDSEEEDHVAKKTKITATTSAQLHSYLRSLELCVDTYRFSTTGIALCNEFVSVWYYDCMGTARTRYFSFADEPQKLMLVLYAMSVCGGTARSGHNVFHKKNTGSGPPTQWRDTHFEFPDPTPEAPDRTVKFVVSGNAPIFQARELLHRRTIVLPAVADRLSSLTLAKGQAVNMDGPPVVEAEGEPDERLAVKFSFVGRPKEPSEPATNNQHLRAPETKTIEKILEAAPELQDHLPKVIFHRLYGSDTDDTGFALQLPRFGILDLADRPSTIRDLLVSVSRRYRPLWEVKDIAEFKKVFIQIFKCHRVVYEKGRFLHRDISEGNVMYDRRGEDAFGILLDFDNASPIDEAGNVIPSHAKMRTGTAPFMAYDLLSLKHHDHLYRHDLESFLYLLVWAALHFDLATKTRLPTNPMVESWIVQDESDLKDARKEKQLCMYSCFGHYEKLRDECRPEFVGVWDDWIEPLRDAFQEGVFAIDKKLSQARIRARRLARASNPFVAGQAPLAADPGPAVTSFDEATLCGSVTYEKFLHILESA